MSEHKQHETDQEAAQAKPEATQAGADQPDQVEQAEPPSGEGHEAEQELLAMRDALLRTRAEMDNLRKRSERELDKARRFINEGLMKDLVPVLDTLDQALENTPEEADAQRQGLLLLKKQLLQSLERHGLEVVDPQGQPFNPDWHEAMSLQPSNDHEPDAVMLVLQRGYTLNGRLLRPARVIVASGPVN